MPADFIHEYACRVDDSLSAHFEFLSGFNVPHLNTGDGQTLFDESHSSSVLENDGSQSTPRFEQD